MDVDEWEEAKSLNRGLEMGETKETGADDRRCYIDPVANIERETLKISTSAVIKPFNFNSAVTPWNNEITDANVSNAVVPKNQVTPPLEIGAKRSCGNLSDKLGLEVTGDGYRGGDEDGRGVPPSCAAASHHAPPGKERSRCLCRWRRRRRQEQGKESPPSSKQEEGSTSITVACPPETEKGENDLAAGMRDHYCRSRRRRYCHEAAYAVRALSLYRRKQGSPTTIPLRWRERGRKPSEKVAAHRDHTAAATFDYTIAKDRRC
nr:hypothetical protein Iba_chr01bCG2670 [Ipomoea batatas]